MINYKYFIYLYCNRKKQKIIHKSAKRSTILEIWRELKTEKKPPYVKTNSGRKRESTNYELALIFPNTRWSTKTFIKDDMGRNLEATIDNDKQRIKELIPYWVEELIYDFDAKKRIRYHELIEQFISVKDIAQVFTLNNKIFLQVDNNVKMFGNKNLDDSDRLFAIIRDDLLKRKTELFRHYSY